MLEENGPARYGVLLLQLENQALCDRNTAISMHLSLSIILCLSQIGKRDAIALVRMILSFLRYVIYMYVIIVIDCMVNRTHI